jgi:small conductance mechanosensitive channel
MPFTKGDYIECCGVAGLFVSIELLYTTILTVDNQVITLPYGQLTISSITNYSRMDSRRLNFSVSIDYDSDIQKARTALLDMLGKDERVLQDPAPYCVVDSYGDSSVNLVLRGWCKNSDFWNVTWDNRSIIKDTLQAAGVTIPYPQLDVQIKNESQV